MPWFWDLVQLSTEIPLQLPVSKLYSNSPIMMCSTAILNISTSNPGIWEWTVPRTRLLCGGGRENCCPSEVINKDHLQMQRKFGGFLHSPCETSLRLFIYLYQHLNRRSSTIDGYRMAIVDTLGPVGHRISQSSDLHRLLSSFHRSSQKFQESSKWNLSVALNELTKAPFEPMKDTDLKHLTLKTAFLLIPQGTQAQQKTTVGNIYLLSTKLLIWCYYRHIDFKQHNKDIILISKIIL